MGEFTGGYTSAVNDASSRDSKAAYVQQVLLEGLAQQWRQQQAQQKQDQLKADQSNVWQGMQPPQPGLASPPQGAQAPAPGAPSVPMMQPSAPPPMMGAPGGQPGMPPPQALAPGAPPGMPPAGGAPAPAAAPAPPPPTWKPSPVAPPALGGQPPQPAQGQDQPTSLDAPPMADPQRELMLLKNIPPASETIAKIDKLPIAPDAKLRMYNEMQTIYDKQSKVLFDTAKVKLEIAKAEKEGAEEAQKQYLRKVFGGIDPTPEMKNYYFATGKTGPEGVMGAQYEMTKKQQADLQKKEATTAATQARGTGGDSNAPGGVGSEILQDRKTGEKYALNQRSGKAWKMGDDGWVQISPNLIPKDATKPGAAGSGMGARESVFTQRELLSANEAAMDLENVAKLPLDVSPGMFGGRKQGPGLMDATKEVLANAVSSQNVQLYNVMATGFQRSLATIEAAGLMPSGSLTHQMDSVILKEGDTNLTKLSKLAQTRQIVDTALDGILENPRVSDEEKAKMREIRARMAKSIPFTQSDVIRLNGAKGEKTTLRDIMPKSDAAGGAIPDGWTVKEKK